MALCLQQTAEGSLVVVSPQPVDISSCSMVVQSGVELMNSPFNLSVNDGATVSFAILTVWAVAWVFRVLIRMLGVFDRDDIPS